MAGRAGLLPLSALLICCLACAPGQPPVETRLILSLGDSLTAGPYGDYPAALQELLAASGRSWRVEHAARPGHNSGEYLDFLSGPERPDLRAEIVILLLGTNDLRIDGDHTPTDQFRENLAAILELISRANAERKHQALVFLATLPPIYRIDLPTFSEQSRLRISREINPAISELAGQRGLPLIDFFSFFRERRKLLPGIHPTAEGYRAMAELVLKNLEPYL